MRQLGHVAQTQVQALPGHRMQGLCCVANRHAAVIDQRRAGMHAQGEYMPSNEGLEMPQPAAEHVVQSAREIVVFQALDACGFGGRAAPYDSVQNAAVRVRQNSQRSEEDTSEPQYIMRNS